MNSQSLSDPASSSYKTELTMASRSISDPVSSSHKQDVAMASQPFSDLPPEVIIGIFSCLHDHHAITALNLTSRKFYEIWKLNTATITKAVLSRAIKCFDLAQELLALQGKSPDGGQVETREAVLKRSKRLLSNAAVVLKDFANDIRVLFADDRAVSLASHYCLWIVMELYNDHEARYWRLQAATLEETRGMAEILDYFNRESEGLFGMLHASQHIVAQHGMLTVYYAVWAALKHKESLTLTCKYPATRARSESV